MKHNIQIRNLTEVQLSEEQIIILNDKEWLNNEYKIKRRTTIEIGKDINVAHSTVGNYLKMHSIEMTYSYKASSYEREIQEFLRENDIVFSANDRSQIKPKELDIYIPEHHLAIELNGVYLHYLNKEQDML